MSTSGGGVMIYFTFDGSDLNIDFRWNTVLILKCIPRQPVVLTFMRFPQRPLQYFMNAYMTKDLQPWCQCDCGATLLF